MSGFKSVLSYYFSSIPEILYFPTYNNKDEHLVKIYYVSGNLLFHLIESIEKFG